MTPKTYYRNQLVATEEGLKVSTEKWISLHETPCFHYCVTEWQVEYLNRVSGPGGLLATAKRRKALKRIHKTGSRFAFDTEEQALQHLRFLKRRQLGHMKRDMAFIERFLESEELHDTDDGHLVPDTRDLVHSFLRFE